MTLAVILINFDQLTFVVGTFCLSEVGQSHPYSAKFKNEWSYTPSPPVYFHGVHRGNFYCIPLGETNVLVRIFGCFIRCNMIMTFSTVSS